MMLNTMQRTIEDSHDPEGIRRIISADYGAAIQIDRQSQLIANSRKFAKQIQAIADYLRSAGMNFNTYALLDTVENDFIFSFRPTRAMTSMSILDFNAPAYYQKGEDYTGKTFYEAVAKVASDFEMNIDELYNAISPLFYTESNSHSYYLIEVPQE